MIKIRKRSPCFLPALPEAAAQKLTALRIIERSYHFNQLQNIFARNRITATMLRGALFCFTCMLAFGAPAQQTNKPVLVNGVPVINPSLSNVSDTMASFRQYNIVPSHRNQSPAQTLNICGVTASFSPGVDSFFANNTTITFTNTSVNATNIQWGINGYYYFGSSAILNYYFRPGLYQVSLVASNGNCRDTFSVIIVCSGNAPTDNHAYSGSVGLLNNGEQATCVAPAKDRGFIIGGNTNYKAIGGNYSNGIFIKLKERNCIEWSMMLMNAMITETCSLRDSGFLVCGSAPGYKNFLMRTDKMGMPLWTKTYSFGAAQFILTGIRHVYEMSDGSLIATTSPFSNGFSIVKMDPQGNVLWDRFLQKEMDQFDYTVSTAILEWKNSLYVVGNFKMPDASIIDEGPFNSFVVKLNPLTGETAWSTMYQSDNHDRSNYFQDIQPCDTSLLVSGLNYYTLGGGDVFPSLQWLDTSGSIYKCISFTQKKYVPNFPTMLRTGALPGGNIFLKFSSQEKIGLQPGYLNHHYYLKVADSSIVFEKEAGGGTIGTFDGETIATIGTGYSESLPWLSSSENIFVWKQDSTGEDNGCSYQSNIFEGHAFYLNQLPVVWEQNISINVKADPYFFETAEVFPQIRSSCPDYIDSCAVLKISGEQSICSLSDTYTYRAGRNNKCGQPVEWNYEGPLSVLNENDSSLTVRFHSFGTYKISVRLRNSCNPMMDSLFVLAASRTSPLYLGADTSLCAGTSFALHASPHFLSYQWQDGSNDSLLTVSSPGHYWVRVTDSCGNLLSDTIQVAEALALSIDIGPDRSKCNNDTLHLSAPSGFINYTWSNNYAISSINSQNVIVNPVTDTAYFIKAEKSTGCFAYDTVRVHVSTSPAIDLGTDKSFCSGDSAVFDAGVSFNTYQWSNSSTAQKITVKNSGVYSVMGVTNEGCKSYDTVSVNVFANPVVSLDHNHFLCTGASRTLDAGNFSSYLWNTGSTGQKITVNDVGTYAVQVTDNNRCMGSDTAVITTLLSLPIDFLPGDTLICSYDKLLLSPRRLYNSYLWSTGASASSITITQPGNYWLQVKDVNDCIGRDSITVNPKECMKGFYIPTAFTPNKDGSNDVFRPLLFGNVKKYQFTIYNRWAQIVFQTTELNKGWDGTLGGISQDPNVFVWTCVYQLEGEAMKSEKGTVMLIR
jgi:gliding motility-associated-like protein